MQFLHTEILEALKQRVEARALAHQQTMAKGLEPSRYWEHVGRHRECRELIDAIEEIAAEKGTDVDEHDGKTAGG